MSVRDEIAEAVASVHMATGGEWLDRQMADALMPIVERVARATIEEACKLGYKAGKRRMLLADYNAEKGAIVRRVVGSNE